MKIFRHITMIAIAVLLMGTTGVLLAACKGDDNPVVSVTLQAGSIASEYKLGSTPDFSNIKVNVKTKDEKTVTKSFSDITISPVNTSTVGLKTVNATYEGFAFTFQITVVDYTPISATLKAGSIPTEYEVGTVINFTNIKIDVVLDSEEEKTVGLVDISLGWVDTSTAGTKTVTGTYMGFEFSFTITVIDSYATPVSAKVKADSIATEYALNSTPDFSGIIVVITYESGKTKDVYYNNPDLLIGSVNTSTTGEKIVNGTYKVTIAFSFKIKVVDYAVPTSFITTGYAMPVAFDLFLNAYTKTQTNKESEFKRLDEPFYVGTDNVFKFTPVVRGIDMSNSDSKVFTPAKYKSTVKVEKVEVKDGATTYTKLEGAALDAIVTFDATTGEFQFKPAAQGSTFKITQTPSEEYNTSFLPTGINVNFQFKVIEGTNVYSFDELLLFHTSNLGSAAWNVWDPWYQYRTSKPEIFGDESIPGDLEFHHERMRNIKALIFQHDFTLTLEHIALSPSFLDKTGKAFNHGQFDETGTIPIEGYSAPNGLFKREMKLGDEFKIIGNYFTLNASSLPKIARATNPQTTDPTEKTQTVPLFSYDFDDGRWSVEYSGWSEDNGNDYLALKSSDPAEAQKVEAADKLHALMGKTQLMSNLNKENSKSIIQNMRFIGNTVRANNTYDFGGLSLVLSGKAAADMKMDNVIASSFGFFGEFGRRKEVIIKDSRFYDAFNQAFMFSNIGTKEEKNAQIINTEIKRAGGPLLYLYHDNPNDTNEMWTTGESVRQQEYIGETLSQEDLLNFSNYKYLAPAVYVFVDEKSVLENLTTGLEGWYIANGASGLVTGLKGLNGVVDGYSGKNAAISKQDVVLDSEGKPKTAEVINFIAAVVASGNPLIADYTPTGGVVLYNGTANNVAYMMDSENPAFKASAAACAGYAPVFANGSPNAYGNSAAYFDGSSLVGIDGNLWKATEGIGKNYIDVNLMLPSQFYVTTLVELYLKS